MVQICNKILEYRYDSRGKKQYTYNPKFVEEQSRKKYEKIMKLHKLFQKIKKTIHRDIFDKDLEIKEIAIILFIMIHCGFRIGNKFYEKNYQSYGISTIKFKHVSFKKHLVEFDFIGKKGIRNISTCDNMVIYNYLLKKSKRHTKDMYVFEGISSKKVNEYLKKFDKSITSKDLRTWTANLWFVEFSLDEIKSGSKKPIQRAIKRVSDKLHNSSAICKKNYIDKNVIHLVEKNLKNDYLNK